MTEPGLGSFPRIHSNGSGRVDVSIQIEAAAQANFSLPFPESGDHRWSEGCPFHRLWWRLLISSAAWGASGDRKHTAGSKLGTASNNRHLDTQRCGSPQHIKNRHEVHFFSQHSNPSVKTIITPQQDTVRDRMEILMKSDLDPLRQTEEKIVLHSHSERAQSPSWKPALLPVLPLMCPYLSRLKGLSTYRHEQKSMATPGWKDVWEDWPAGLYPTHTVNACTCSFTLFSSPPPLPAGLIVSISVTMHKGA